jgi:hypothetical protein
MGFGVSVEIDCGKTNATAATIIRKSLAAIPMRTEVHRGTAAYPGIWSSIRADTETSKEAFKIEAAVSISLLAQHQLGRLTPDSIDRTIILAKFRDQYKMTTKNQSCHQQGLESSREQNTLRACFLLSRPS